jgi:hypothetical protein
MNETDILIEWLDESCGCTQDIVLHNDPGNRASKYIIKIKFGEENNDLAIS